MMELECLTTHVSFWHDIVRFGPRVHMVLLFGLTPKYVIPLGGGLFTYELLHLSILKRCGTAQLTIFLYVLIAVTITPPFGAQCPHWSHFQLGIGSDIICYDSCLPLV